MSEKINISDIVVAWVLFWVLTALGLVLIAGSILVPLWQDQYHLAQEYQMVRVQIDQIEDEVNRSRAQLDAICVDPLYTERIARSELNLRKAGEETLRIKPLPYSDEPEAPDLANQPMDRDFSHYWWYKLFLDDTRRQWYIILAACLLATAIITAIATKDRRRAEIGL